MKYFNISLLGLRGKPHPAICDVTTSREVKMMRPHCKMLLGNYLTLQEKSEQSGGPSACQLCESVSESRISESETVSVSGISETVDHLISTCFSLSQERSRLITQYDELFLQSGNIMSMSDFIQNAEDP